MFKSVLRGFLISLGLVGIILGSSNAVFASGVAIIEQDVQGLGNAFSGGAAVADNAATIFFNPAGMTRLSGNEVKAATHVIVPTAEFDNEGSSVTAAGGGAPLTGGEGGDGGEVAVIPNAYYVHSLSENLKIGIGVSGLFGFTTDYDHDWVGRYHATESSLENKNINPSIAYRFNKNLSFGFGLNAQKSDLVMENAIDFGLLGALAGAGTAPQSMDGYVKLEADDWGYGYNFGFLVEPNENTRFGFSYRSKIDIEYEGDADFAVPAGMEAVAAAFGLTNTDITGEISFPASASLSFFHRFNERWDVMADVSWTDWSQFKEIRIEFENGAADGVTTLEWEDTMRYSVGVNYHPSEQWVYRAGIAMDQTPIPSDERRTPRIPGADRLWITFGTGYQYSENLSFDFGYAFLYIDDPTINKTETAPGQEDFTRGNLVGEYDANVNILSFEVSYNF